MRGERRRFKIDHSPKKHLIPIIVAGDMSVFREFYDARVKWHESPLISDRFVTYGLCDDLFCEMTGSVRLRFLPRLLDFALLEPDRHLHIAVGLAAQAVSNLSSWDVGPSVVDTLYALRPRVQAMSFFPNMTCFWDRLLDALLPPKERKPLEVRREDYLGFIDLDFPQVDDKGWLNCPAGDADVLEEVGKIHGDEYRLVFQRNALFKKDKYWVWLYEDISERPIWHWYIYVVQGPEGQHQLHIESMHVCVALSPEELILRHHYGLTDSN